MAAGDFAAQEVSRQLALGAAPENADLDARASASPHVVVPTAQQRTASVLAPLTDSGYHLLPDRQWPGSRRSRVDMVVVGPGGVFVVDTKTWADDVTVAGDRIHHGHQDVTEELMTLADLAYRTEGELAEIGLAPGEVHAIAVLSGRSRVDERVGPVRVVGDRDVLRQIARRGSRLGPRRVEEVLARCREWFTDGGDAAPVSTTLPEPVLPAPRGPVLLTPDEPVGLAHDDDLGADVPGRWAAPDGPESLLSEAEVHQAMFEGLMAEPVEEWMSFLHPAQAYLVRRSFNGPARIRGASGTGKTVVGLHRAAYLARTREGKVLVTTYIPTLPDVLRQQLTRLAPDVVDRVELAGVHETAKRILDERGVACHIDGKQIAAAWTSAWGKVAGGSVIDTDLHEQDYWHDEVSYVIKGRGLTRWEQYAELPRRGRRHRLDMQQRRVVWNLYEAYGKELRDRGVHDFADQISLAEAELRREPPTERYTAVVVDEAQDLTAVMIRMLHAFVGDAPDGLTLIGDGQQTIYPGGFTLAEAGVSVAGRGAVLDVNHRNTREILQFASLLVKDDEFADIEGATARGDQPTEVARTGVKPVYVRCVDEADRQRRMVQRVHEVVAEVGTNFGDVGVLSLSRRGVEAATEALKKAGVPVVNLEKYDGVPVNRVKVGTVKRAKGLEFKQVLVVDVAASWITEKADELDDVDLERRDHRLRELYVAMTRARDGLWVASI